MLDRFQSLAAAWDAMDPQYTGEVTKQGFPSVVVFKLGYCRNSEARRLFEALPKKDAHRFTWRDLGLTAEDWLEFSTKKSGRNCSNDWKRKRKELVMVQERLCRSIMIVRTRKALK